MDKTKLKRHTNRAVPDGVEQAVSERRFASYSEPRRRFGELIADANGNEKQLEKELRQKEEINELIMTEDAVEMTYHLACCPNCMQGENSDESLISLIGCNIYDEHFDNVTQEQSM